MEQAKNKARQLIDENPVMVFSKSYCPYCHNSKRILNSLGVKYRAVELDEESDGPDVQAALLEMTGQRTVPNIFIGKEHIGGNSDLEARSGKDLKQLLANVGAL